MNPLLLLSIALLSSLARAAAPVVSLPADALPVPLTRQATVYSCGAAAAVGVLRYWQAWEGPEMTLHKMLDTTEAQGTHPKKILETLKTFGLKAELKKGMTAEDLRGHLLRGETVILDIQAWPDQADRLIEWKNLWDSGHYVVLVAIDDANAYVMDPSVPQGYAWLPVPELLERWHDFENRYGTYERNIHLGIIASGANPLQAFPGSLLRLE